MNILNLEGEKNCAENSIICIASYESFILSLILSLNQF